MSSHDQILQEQERDQWREMQELQDDPASREDKWKVWDKDKLWTADLESEFQNVMGEK